MSKTRSKLFSNTVGSKKAQELHLDLSKKEIKAIKLKRSLIDDVIKKGIKISRKKCLQLQNLRMEK